MTKNEWLDIVSACGKKLEGRFSMLGYGWVKLAQTEEGRILEFGYNFVKNDTCGAFFVKNF